MKIIKSILLSMIIFVFLVTGCTIIKDIGDNNKLAKSIKSEEHLKELLNRKLDLPRSAGGKFSGFDETAVPESGTDNDVSETNVQVDGVDEGDTVKIDANYIYKIQTSGLSILKVDVDGSLKVESKVELENYNPIELYVNGDILIMIGGVYTQIKYDDMGFGKVGAFIDLFAYHSDVDVRIYDIKDRSNIIEEQHYTIEGNYVTSRRIDDSFYLITDKYYYNFMPYFFGEKGEAGASSSKETLSPLPQISVNGSEREPISLDDVYYYEDSIGSNFFTIMKIDTTKKTDMMLKSYLCDYAGNIYVSSDYIYNALYSYTYFSNPILNIHDYKVYTNVQRFKLDTLENDIMFKVEGYIKDRYSIDEYNSYFRIATTNANNTTTSNGVYVFDKDGNLVGKVDNLAPGERIFSARFDKDKAYIITFQQIDPLFVIDLSDVTNPTVKSELKKEGVSLYLHDFTNSPLMLGIGHNTKDGRMIGMEVVLFDVSDDKNPKILDDYTTENSSFYAEVLYNPRALLFMESKAIFGFASEESSYQLSNGAYRYNSKQGYYVFKVVDNKLETHFLSHIPVLDLEHDWTYQSYIERYKKYITRGVVIGDYLYTISDQVIGIYDVDTLKNISYFNLG